MKELKQNELKDFVSKGDVAVDFWASWCGPCKMLEPIFKELSEELNDISFAKANIDDVGDEAVAFGIRGVPTIIFFKDGKEINRVSGFLPKETLKSQMREVFN